MKGAQVEEQIDRAIPWGESVTFDLRQFPLRTWIQLQDQKGEAIRLAIHIDQGAVGGRWLLR